MWGTDAWPPSCQGLEAVARHVCNLWSNPRLPFWQRPLRLSWPKTVVAGPQSGVQPQKSSSQTDPEVQRGTCSESRVSSVHYNENDSYFHFSCSSSQIFRSKPPPKPVSEPFTPTTRWHGNTMATGLRPLAPPTARTAAGRPTHFACCP